MKVVLGVYKYCSEFSNYIHGVTGFIPLMYLNIITLMEAANLLVVHNTSMYDISGAFDVGKCCARF